MRRNTKLRIVMAVLVLMLALVAVGGPASANHLTNCPRARVCLWDGINFTGDRPVFGARSNVIYNLTGFDDRAGSIKVNTCCRDVTVATEHNLQGDTLCIHANESIANLDDAGIGVNTISSLVVHESPANVCPDL